MTSIISGGMVPGNYSAADAAPAALLATEPEYHRGVNTEWQKEAERTITFTWTVGEGDKWKQTTGANERVTFDAVLNVTHNKKGRGPAHYSATLWQHQTGGSGMTGVLYDGHNGLRVLTDTAGAGRYNAAKLEAFAYRALTQLRAKSDDPAVLAYFRPERV